jgi:hypothetical protein
MRKNLPFTVHRHNDAEKWMLPVWLQLKLINLQNDYIKGYFSFAFMQTQINPMRLVILSLVEPIWYKEQQQYCIIADRHECQHGNKQHNNNTIHPGNAFDVFQKNSLA